MKILILDTETGGQRETKPEDNFLTEVGAILYDVTGEQTVVELSRFVSSKNTIDPWISDYTGITDWHLETFGVPATEVMAELDHMASFADAVVAHNGLAFDKLVLDKYMLKYEMGNLQKLPWVDTMFDVEYPQNCTHRNLHYLAGFHGVANPQAHRALSDCKTLLGVLLNYEIEKVLANAQAPLVTLEWSIEYPKKGGSDYAKRKKEFDEKKDFVKALGFRWVPEEKLWRHTCRQNKIPDAPAGETFRMGKT